MKIVDKVKGNQKLMRFIETTQVRITESEMGTTSVVVAYYLLFSLFPLLIAVGNLLPFLSIDPNTVLPYVQELFPSEIYDFIGPAIENLLTTSSGGLLSISVLAALWSASQSINALQIAMNKAFGVEQRANFIVVRAVSFVILLLFMIAIVGVTMVFGLGKMILDLLQPIFQFPDNIISTFQTLKWPLTIFALLFIMMMIYWLVPNAKVKLRSTLPGAIFSTVGWMLLSQVFGLYARYFTAKISGYQIIGSFIVLMIWLNLAATIVILGGIINAVVEEYVTGQEIRSRKDPVERLSSKIEDTFTNKEK
ncbi:YihY/virulence factor BrkB family protein [Enterococcus sp.]|uniref:YihY/virulence factor BrkB family protein n=1 Tax=Enterococcus sp. TaxID=35783 RepID=UPI0028A73BD5|nr:YihY/virulence factor BrkB family protein [Enterococcus sp.]